VSSTNLVNFSVRQNKSIERQIVFDSLRELVVDLGVKELIYIGLGSVWFSDFILAHRDLGIEEMYSVEEDPIIYQRAKFNHPYRTVEIVKGSSERQIPRILRREGVRGRPCVVWIDYDKAMDQNRMEELKALVQALPDDSFLLTTCKATPRDYGASLKARAEQLQAIFGDSLDGEIEGLDLKNPDLVGRLLSNSINNKLASAASKCGRVGGFVKAFDIRYRDGSPMVTAGGVLPAKENRASASLLVKSAGWQGIVKDPIETPHLTAREIATLQAEMPRHKRLTRSRVRELGFDLEVAQIKSFQDHYRIFPRFAQVAE